MKIAVRYFALLSEQAGLATEQLEHEGDLATLYADCVRRHSFTLSRSLVRPAVNDTFVDWDHSLRTGDLVAFIPPVSGG